MRVHIPAPWPRAGVTLGSFKRRRLTVSNKSAIFSEIFLDLTDYPDFYVAPPSLFSGERDDVSIGDESMFQAESIGACVCVCVAVCGAVRL